MANECFEVEKILRFLIENGTIKIFNKEDDIVNYLKEINNYKWPKGAMLECHLVVIEYCARLLQADEFFYFSYFKWLVLWLKIKRIYKIPRNGKARDNILQEFLTVKQILKCGKVVRSGHQFANPLSEIYHLYAHYTDTRRSLCFQNHFSHLQLDERLEETFLQGPFPRKLKSISIVEKCFSYYLHDLTDKMFIKRHEVTDIVQNGGCENKKYEIDDIMGIRYRFKNNPKYPHWRVAIMFRKGDQEDG